MVLLVDHHRDGLTLAKGNRTARRWGAPIRTQISADQVSFQEQLTQDGPAVTHGHPPGLPVQRGLHTDPMELTSYLDCRVWVEPSLEGTPSNIPGQADTKGDHDVPIGSAGVEPGSYPASQEEGINRGKCHVWDRF